MRRPINVFVVAPPMLCFGFRRVVESGGADVWVVGSAPVLAQAASHVNRLHAHVVVADYDEVLEPEALRTAGLQLPILLLAPAREQQHIGRWTRSGVVAVLPKSGSREVLLLAIRSACDGLRPDAAAAMIRLDGRLPAHATPEPAERSRLDSLTARERQLLIALVCNSTTPGKVLAAKLCISEHTLRNHLTSVYCKLGVHGRLSLHDYALRHHLGDGVCLLDGERLRPGWRARPSSDDWAAIHSEPSRNGVPPEGHGAAQLAS